MQKMLIQVPEKKSKLVKSLLKELGVVVDDDIVKMAKRLNKMVKSGKELSMDEIVKETRNARATSQ
jgi:hypothetical protein